MRIRIEQVVSCPRLEKEIDLEECQTCGFYKGMKGKEMLCDFP